MSVDKIVLPISRFTGIKRNLRRRGYLRISDMQTAGFVITEKYIAFFSVNSKSIIPYSRNSDRISPIFQLNQIVDIILNKVEFVRIADLAVVILKKIEFFVKKSFKFMERLRCRPLQA